VKIVGQLVCVCGMETVVIFNCSEMFNYDVCTVGEVTDLHIC